MSTSDHGRTFPASTPTVPNEVAFEQLSPEAAWTLVNVAWPISSGLSISEVAGRLGETVKWTSGRLDDLREELERRGC